MSLYLAELLLPVQPCCWGQASVCGHFFLVFFFLEVTQTAPHGAGIPLPRDWGPARPHPVGLVVTALLPRGRALGVTAPVLEGPCGVLPRKAEHAVTSELL